jgi:hypothetical protein
MLGARWSNRCAVGVNLNEYKFGFRLAAHSQDACGSIDCIQCNALSCKQVHSRSFAPTVELSAAINSNMRGRCQRRFAGIKLATLPCCTCLHTPHPLVGRSIKDPAAGWLGGHLACHRRHKAGACMRKTCTQLALAYLCFHSDWIDLLFGRGGSQTKFNAIQDL